MSRSRTRSDTSTSSAQTSNVQNLNLQEIDGIAVAGVDGNVSIVNQTVDGGLVDASLGIVDAGTEITLAGIAANERGFQETVDLASGVIDASRAQTETVAGLAQSVVEEGFDFAGGVTRDAFLSAEQQTSEVLNFAANAQSGVFELVQDTNARSLDLASDLSGQFIEETSNLQDQFLNLGASLIGETQDFIGQAGQQVIGAVNDIQRRESGNTDARLEEITRVALIGAGLVAAAAIAIQLRK